MVIPEEVIHLTIFWLQPIFWMLFFHVRRPTWTSPRTLVLPMSLIILVGIHDLFQLNFLGWIPSHCLLVSYSSIGLILAWHLMNNKGWPFPQALSYSALVVFVSSFYWEIPVILYNAVTTGFEWDWLLHILALFPAWYLYKAVGLNQTYTPQGLLSIFMMGILISTIFLYLNPIPPGLTADTSLLFWDSPAFLTNRVVCVVLTFFIWNSDRSAISRYV